MKLLFEKLGTWCGGDHLLTFFDRDSIFVQDERFGSFEKSTLGREQCSRHGVHLYLNRRCAHPCRALPSASSLFLPL